MLGDDDGVTVFVSLFLLFFFSIKGLKSGEFFKSFVDFPQGFPVPYALMRASAEEVPCPLEGGVRSCSAGFLQSRLTLSLSSEWCAGLVSFS